MLKPSEDPRSVDQLVHEARAAVGRADTDDFPGEYWKAVWALQYRVDAALLAQLLGLAQSQDPMERRLVADVLGQGHPGTKRLSAESVGVLLEMFGREVAPVTLVALCQAFGYHRSPASVPPLARLRAHPDAAVREAVVQGLLQQDSPVAVEALIDLSRDEDREVRNWATFGVGSLVDADSPAIREALLARATEEDEEISGEALVGLARRGDIRVVAPLLASIESVRQSHQEFGQLLLEAAEGARTAAARTPDNRWQPLLRKLDELGLGLS